MDKAKLDGMYKCSGCGKYFSPKKVNRDHIEPVENPVTGYTDLDNYVKRLLVKSDQYQILCEDLCHPAKTLTENTLRQQYGQKAIKTRNKKKKSLKKNKILGKIKK